MRKWSNKKFKRQYWGHYSYHNGERVFELTNGMRTITFESWQMAKQMGWKLK